MRGTCLLFVGAVSLLYTGCSAHGNFPTHHAHLWASAEKILRRSVRDIRGWTKEDRVAVINLDSVLAEDEHIPSLVTDALISAVVEAGVAVVERDSDALRWVAQEGSGERISFGATGYSKDADHPMVIDAELMGARRYVPGTRYLLDGENYIEADVRAVAKEATSSHSFLVPPSKNQRKQWTGAAPVRKYSRIDTV